MFCMSDIFRKRKKCEKVHNPEPRQLDQFYIYIYIYIYTHTQTHTHTHTYI